MATNQDDFPVSSSESYTALQWRKEKPSKPGFYLFRHKLLSSIDGSCKVYKSSTGLRIRGNGAPLIDELSDEWEWAGPIPEPVSGVAGVMARTIAVCGGGDWADASVDHINVPEDMDLERQYSLYRAWRDESDEFKRFPEWLVDETEAVKADNVERFYEL